MEKVIIKDIFSETTLFMNQNFYYGYTIKDSLILPVREDISFLFSYFSLSKKHSSFSKEGKYFVCLDYMSGFKHYFYKGKEDFKQFFIHNGQPTTCYLGNNRMSDEIRSFVYRNKIFLCSLAAILCLQCSTPTLVRNIQDLTQSVYSECIDDYSLEDIRNYIYSSPNLDDDEKEFLYNPDFLVLVLDAVNQSNVAKSHFSSYFQNISIEPLILEKDYKGPTGGRYQLSTPNTLYVNGYHCLTSSNQDTVAHEYVHLCQDTTGYNLIIESCAEIISHEFFSHHVEESYSSQVKMVKKLMEIIGTDAVWYYNFTGDFSQIEEQVRTYLCNEEYQDFIDILTFDYVDHNANKLKSERFDELLEIMYQNKYHQSIKDNPLFEYIDTAGLNLHRYYFNPSLKNESYYTDYSFRSNISFSYEEAINSHIIQVHAIQYTPIEKKEAFQIVEEGEGSIKRIINYDANNVTIIRNQHSSLKEIVSIIVDGVRYDDVDLDDLVKKGILQVDYYVVNQKVLTYEEYANHHYWDDAELLITTTHNAKLLEDHVEAFIPQRIDLPPVGECDKMNQKVLY